jgi:TonB-linked SusC/RagA family outer membrane protein
MKLTITLLLFAILAATAGSTYSQSTRINLKMKDASLIDVFREIERTSQFGFFFKSEELDLNKHISVDLENATIEEILKAILVDNYSYRIIDKNIIIKKENSTEVQQQKSVTGKATDSTGAPLPGVTVVQKGSTNGTITDADGKYIISKIPDKSTLVFSFVGMKSQEILVNGRTTINVTLTEETVGIEEVVAVGYGTQKKSDLTGSVVSVKMDKMEMSANVNVTQALQGYVPGVNVGASAKAGETGSLSIRGRTSLSASDNPLIVLDGIIYNGGLSDIDVNDVETIDILKDASAAAVYGSRSANGVVIITTKKGKTEKPTFNFNAYYGFQDMTNTKRTDVMNGDQYAIRMVDYYYQQSLYGWYKTNPTDATNRPVRPDVTDRTLVAKSLRSAEEQENYLAGKEINWVDEVTRTAPIQSYNLSVSGKTDRTNYFLSGSYTSQKGVMINDQFKRPTIRANFENKITNWFSFGLNTSYSHVDYSGLCEDYLEDGINYAGMYLALIASPLANKYNSSGIYPTVLTNESYMRHPLGNTLVDDLQTGDNYFLVLSSKVDIPKIKGLRYEVNYSYTYDNAKHAKFYPATTFEGSSTNGLAKKDLSEERDWLLNNVVTYNRTFAKNHKFDVTLLYSREAKNGESSNLVSNTFPNPVLGFNAMQLGQNVSLSTGAWEENTISYMGRINYGFKNRYMATATFRRDGYSGFGANNKFTNFPSVSFGWVASEESFLHELKWLDFLKLRLSYGLNGNQGIGRYASLAKMGTTYYTFNNSTAIGVYPSSLGNSSLGWESTHSANVGLDFKVLDQRISVEIDVYNAKTSNVLVNRTIPATTGYSNVWTNIGGIQNKGFEIGLTTVNVKTLSFNWQSRFQFSINRDKITKLYGGENDQDLGNSWFVGKPISSIYSYVVDGVWQEKDLFNKTILANYYPGQYRLKDLNNDGKITADYDRKIIGYGTPNYRFSINNTFNYKNFTLNIFINSIQGGNGYYLSNNYDAVVAGGTDTAYRINRPAVRSYWRPDQPVNNAPGMYYSPSVGHGVYESRSFVRLQDVSLSYDFGKLISKQIGFNNLQVYLSGKNLYTWTKWSGWDPEVSSNSPMMRSIIAGIKLSF